MTEICGRLEAPLSKEDLIRYALETMRPPMLQVCSSPLAANAHEVDGELDCNLVNRKLITSAPMDHP